MKNRLPRYPNRVKLIPVPGEENLFDLVRADEPTEEGTPLNKQTLLSDSTAALFGLDNSAVPDDVFAWLGEHNRHWWRKAACTPPTFSLGAEETINGIGSGTFWYSDDVVVTWGGIALLAEPVNEISFSDPASIRDFMNSTAIGKYFMWHGDVDQVAFRPETPATRSGDWIYVPYLPVTGIGGAEDGSVEYVTSDDSDTWPKDGVLGDVRYQYLGRPLPNAVNTARFVWGSYGGTGTHGSAAPNVLTFEEPPKLVAITHCRRLSDGAAGSEVSFTHTNVNGFSNWITDMRALSTEFSYDLGPIGPGSVGSSYAKRSEDGRQLIWYNTNSPYTQCNALGHEYFYFAIL